MGLESATYVTDLNTANPETDDPRAQGDDHLRLIKACLLNSFPIDMRNVSSVTEGQILVIDNSSNLVNTSIYGLEVSQSSLTLNAGVVNTITIDTETTDEWGLWAGGNPTRFTLPENYARLHFLVKVAYSGHTTGVDRIRFLSSYNSGANNILADHLIYDTSGTVVQLVPWINGSSGDYAEFKLIFYQLDTADSGISADATIEAYRVF